MGRWLISCSRRNVVTKGAVDVNSLNQRGLTALDVLRFFQSEAGDREIEEILRQAGARRAGDSHSLAQAAVYQNQSVSEQSQSPARRMLEYFKYDHIKDSPNAVRNTLPVIAILIVTATYQAALSPLGGVWPDDSGTNATKSHTVGQSVMGFHNPTAYSLFLFFNSMGFFTSIHMIYVLTCRFPKGLEFNYLKRREEVTPLTNMVESSEPIQSQDVLHVLSETLLSSGHTA
ncbi:hypothetical protein F0562_018564 [Nyssa sinensis]|uniref:PGG domain-containing protein n=1 Tax=Nyssa sinensis TaxID=561372 RepID=A0A5J4ZB59_9ASTE|nr:hypothetical protein F0562_018564 [Nyssa sinensis]